MSSKEFNTLASRNQKSVRIKGHEFKMHSCGTIVNLQQTSMSLGNILESRELLAKYHPEVLKFSILSMPSESIKEPTTVDFITAEKRLYYFYQTLNNINIFADENIELNDSIAPHGRIIKPDIVNGIEVSFCTAINDKFNTFQAVSEFSQVFKYLNALLNNTNENPLHKLTTLNKIHLTILKVATLLGILLEKPEVFILEMKEKYIRLNNIDVKEIEELMNLRQEAKLKTDYALADELKTKLDQKGIIIRDSQFGYEWDIKELFI